MPLPAVFALRRDLLIELVAVLLATAFWPELRNLVASLGGVFSRPGATSIIVLIVFAAISVLLSPTAGDDQPPNDRPPLWVTLFIKGTFVLGVLSLVGIQQDYIPSDRGGAALLHVLALMGAALIIDGMIKRAIRRFLQGV